ncbi:DUF4124 domain-containing protein [Dyella silvae]|uniref:DUF4124 domain-containing protein n=1 Tax=Dyella silvae TaxID=2994424 RepID=UPI002264956A|nr:DUF4124 domain-containing protein [Dyella silvae]
MIQRFALLLILLLCSASALAQDGIHRCVGPDGNPLFTDQPCAALQATPVAAPSEPSPNLQTPTVTEPPPVLCASSVAELRQSVLDAFASRNPNRLAGLMLWGGYGHDAVVADIRSMSALMRQTLLDVGEDTGDPPSASSSPGDAGTPPPRATANPRIVVRTVADDGSGAARETHFNVVRRSGCLWLRNSG